MIEDMGEKGLQAHGKTLFHRNWSAKFPKLVLMCTIAIADGIRIMANDTVTRALSVIHWNVQDDSLHDYYSRSSKIGGGRRYGTTIDYGHQPPRFVQ